MNSTDQNFLLQILQFSHQSSSRALIPRKILLGDCYGSLPFNPQSPFSSIFFLSIDSKKIYKQRRVLFHPIENLQNFHELDRSKFPQILQMFTRSRLSWNSFLSPIPRKSFFYTEFSPSKINFETIPEIQNRSLIPSNPQATAAPPRSFFGVEDFVDEDNSRPYTYTKEKKPRNPENRKHVSFKQRTIAYMEPFSLDVFISKRFVSASITHRVTSKQVAVAGTNSKDIKAVLQSRSDIPACIAVGRILADRAREADVYTATYTPRERDKFEGKIRAVVQSLIDNGIDVKVYLD
ncbi:ribosomal L18p/L5e family protein isoform X1 [Wolffia australiana]